MNGEHYHEPIRQGAARSSKNKGIITVIVLAVIGIAAYCLFFGIIPDNKLIKEAKNTSVAELALYTNVTYGEVLDNYCSNPKWSVLNSSIVETVEFRGSSPKGTIFIQLTKELTKGKNGKFWLNYIEINGRIPDSVTITDFFMAALLE